MWGLTLQHLVCSILVCDCVLKSYVSKTNQLWSRVPHDKLICPQQGKKKFPAVYNVYIAPTIKGM